MKQQQARPTKGLSLRSAPERTRRVPIHMGDGGSFMGTPPMLSNHGVLSAGVLQRKLTVGKPNDQFEQEADRVAHQVMRMPRDIRDSGTEVLAPSNHSLQRKCSCGGTPGPTGECAECRKKRLSFQRRATNAHESGGVPPIVHEVLRSPGQPLDAATRAFMEPRFGHDFSQVRAHTDAKAADSAHAVNAQAYTVGQHIVSGGRSFDQGSPESLWLLGHELAHVVQQQVAVIGSEPLAVSPAAGPLEKEADQAASQLFQPDLADTRGRPLTTSPPTLSPQLVGVPMDIKEQLEKAAEAFATAQLGALAAKPGPAATFSLAGCPANFCQPFASKTAAAADLVWAGPLILAGIAKKVNSRVVPLWTSYLTGGSSPRSLTPAFGADFTASSTTADTTDFLVRELRNDVEANQTTLMGGAATATIDFTPRLSTALTAITTPGDPDEMNFDVIGDIAGNVAGGIGTDQLAFPIGARPSPFNDDRTAKITATLARNLAGDLTVTPAIGFSIHDTIDLCPGNCGAPSEQVATIPLSRFEATGLVGDVPFTIDFPAPAAKLSPFVVAPPAPALGPIPGVVTASLLRIRAAPTTASAILGSYPNGTAITILCETMGETIDGNPRWDKTDKGFISDRFVSRTGLAGPPTC